MSVLFLTLLYSNTSSILSTPGKVVGFVCLICECLCFFAWKECELLTEIYSATNFEDRKPSHPDLKDVRLPELAESEGTEGLVPEG